MGVEQVGRGFKLDGDVVFKDKVKQTVLDGAFLTQCCLYFF
jgi:hypothetical protein